MAGYTGERKINPNMVGAGWLKESTKGKKYVFLKLNLKDKDIDISNVGISLFRNDRKQEGSNAPDYQALLSIGYGKKNQPAASGGQKPAAAPKTGSDPF